MDNRRVKKDSIQRISSGGVAVIGYASRLPGADNIDQVWDTLINGRCNVRSIPDSRWSATRFFDPNRDTPGKTYARSAGLLENVYDFDAGYFGLSPREAAQMDPQQRILLETVAHAFDHAGIDPTKLEKERTGVFVGASSSDHSTIGLKDPTMIDAHYMLGNTLSIISNRISYHWDLTGPSYTVDTACSSGLFALDQAFRAINEGEIDTAVVGSVNVLLSPLPFVGFSRASMLSPRGLCHAFGKDADGYVRAEGAVVFVLRRADLARVMRDRIRSLVVATGTNSDGRTTGIAMPSSARQFDLLEKIKGKFGINVDDLAFIEAHGTGTPVGDPEEAQAIGAAYGRNRSMPLPIGSAKTNFGHLEPAAGLVGLLKAQLSLEKGLLPPTLHAGELNPNIPFEDLGLEVAREPVSLQERPEPWLAAINSFGFGGANAHAILSQAKYASPKRARFPDALVLTTASENALKELADTWIKRTETQTDGLAQAVVDANQRHTRHQKRLVVAAGSAERLNASLSGWLCGENTPMVAKGTARIENAKVGFVFSGNGSQWAGMGRHMLLCDPVFQESLTASNEISIEWGGASLLEQIMSVDLDEHLHRAPVAQPLLLAIQIATVDALEAYSVKPDAVLGHSAGEVAAAYACGAITREDAFRIILARSATLDRLYGNGTMAALSCDVSQAEDIIASSNLDIDIAAENSPTSITVSGPGDDVAQLIKLCRQKRIAGRKLSIEYAYHSRQVENLQSELVNELEGICGAQTDIPFFSGCTGGPVPAESLDNHFWWRNARDAVQFRSGIEAMSSSGVSVFLEISPKSVLQAYVRDTLEGASLAGFALGSLEQTGAEKIDPFTIALKLMAHGVAVENTKILGDILPYQGDLPTYPFDRKTHTLHSERERDLWGTHAHHALLGSRVDPDAYVWTSELSLSRLPWLADHKVDGRILVPATAIVEMLLAAIKDVSTTEKLELRHVEILRPIQLREGMTAPTRVTYEKEAHRLTLETLQGGDWNWVAGAAVFDLEAEAPEATALSNGAADPDVYADLAANGLDYGAAFSRLDRIGFGKTSVDVHLSGSALDTSGFVLDPTATDACLHGLFPLLKSHGEDQIEQLFVPGHIGRVRVYCSDNPVGARLHLVKGDKTGICINVSFFSGDGLVIAEMMSVWFRPLPTTRKTLPYLWNEKTVTIDAGSEDIWRPAPALAQVESSAPSDLEVVRNAIGARLAWNVARARVDGGQFDRRLSEAESLLEAMDVARFDEGSALDEEDCPWPDLPELLKLLIEIEPDAVDEIDGTLHGTTTEKTNGTPGFARLRDAVLDYLSELPISDARVLLVGHIDPAVVKVVTEKASHVVVAADTPDSVDALRLSLDHSQNVHIVALEEALTLPSFDLTIAAAVAQTTLTSMHRQLARFVARGNPAIFFDYKANVFELMTGRYSNGDAVRMLDDEFADLGLTLERKVWRHDASLTFAYLGLAKVAPQEPKQVAIFGTSKLADRLREVAVPRSGEETIAIIALDASDDLVSTVLIQSEALRDLPGHVDIVWIVQDGLAGSASLKGLRRVLRNELGRDIRAISVAPDVASSKVLELAASTREQEVMLTENRTSSTRIVHQRSGPAKISPNERLVLSQSPSGRTESIYWATAPRTAPKDDEIEIEVAATALNFRDVMFARGLLPPDILHGGYAGPTLGMECAGVVTRAGPGASFMQGDRVIAFSPNAFATHVTINSRAATAAPSALELKAAATIPVIFVTAEYALTELARIRSGEWCLIHGGAGGVGLAAIQVAKRAGAKIIATAGSEKKRALLRLLDVDHVCDSRSLEFVDEVDRITGGRGVDVILNSLAGKAMEQGLSCLAPFGRFVELGKRDFVANTSIGLRAMRNNISYFGVDADQLLQHRPDLSDRIMKNIAEGFEAGEYSVPPVRTFSSDHVVDAFRLMENSGHIGKVVVTPPTTGEKTASAPADFTGTWLIAGGTKGFGLETARALAAKGADRLWLVSRSGQLRQSAFIDEMSRLGATVEVRSTDLTDRDAVRTLFDEIEHSDGDLAGLVCGAAVFDDAMLRDMDADRFERVVRTKLGSALILDSESRRFGTRHFWLFSSVSCRFGNPGQAAYVAANMELEALARRRNEEGLPGLAIAWGPIGDAGYLTQAGELKAVIERKLGSVMTAKVALMRLFDLVEIGFDQPTITIASVDWSRLKSELPLISEPLFEYLDIRVSEVGEDGLIDIPALIAEKGETKTRKIILDLLCQEAAQIMRIAPGEIDVNRGLTDLGFDSLMGMSLKLAMEERLGTAAPISSVGDGMTLSRLTHLIMMSAKSGSHEDEADVMAERHLSEVNIPSKLKDEISNAATR